MADIDAVIRKCVDDIWKEYDKDGSGSLDKAETKRFVKNTLKEMDDSAQFSDADFEACFKEFDEDGSGFIEKDEMAVFIKKVAGV
jgi:Ca2+-binding EF-hand superfamily protein